MLLDQSFVLDAQVFYFVVPLLQFHLDLVPFFFRGLQLRNQNVLVNLDFFLALLHRHFKLILSVFKAVYFISTSVNFLTKTLNLELHDIVLDESLLFYLDNSLEVASSHFILEFQLSNY